MGKKYMDTKKDTLEQSVLDVWQEAADMHAEDMDGRTKEYRSHRSQLETNRIRRENKRKSVKTEQPETQDGSDKRAYEMGTDRYAEYIHKLTPGQMENKITSDQIREEIAELNALIKELDEGILGNIAKAAGRTAMKGVKAVGQKAVGAVKKKVGGSMVGKAVSKVKSGVKKVKTVGSKIKKAVKTGQAYGDEYNPMLEELNIIESKLNEYYKIMEEVELDEGRMEGNEMKEKLDLTDTIKNLWIEAASSAVNPKDREDLDGGKGATGTGGKETAKKMKRAKEPAPGQMTEGTKEEYQKFFNAAMKKFKINSPADLKSDEEKKKFFDYVDKNYKGEKSEELLKSVEAHETWLDNKKIELTKEFKVSSMRQALEKVWSAGDEKQQEKEDKKVKTKVEDHDDEDEKKKGDTMTGKKKASVDVNPHKGSY